MTDRKITRALLSVSDKAGLVEFAKSLAQHGIELISTGGSANLLRDAGLDVQDVSAITGFPEIMDGRVKTLHPKVHGGLLAMRDNADHQSAAKEHAIAAIDLLVVNLYPFEKTIAGHADFATSIENIDIGGPAMIRAAAKNHDGVTVVVDPADYPLIIGELRAHNGATCANVRRKLAAKAFARTAAYDSAIANWFARSNGTDWPKWMSFSGEQMLELRYGENPHQDASLYATSENRAGVATAEKKQGKALSYNNINDTDAAFELVAEFDPGQGPAVAIIKHANPCGVALGASQQQAYQRALACDPVSAFGGIIALNQEIEAATAEEIAKLFAEVIIAPSVSAAAMEIFAAKKNLRVLTTGSLPDSRTGGHLVKTIAGGLLVQSRDNGCVDDLELKVVTNRAPAPRELDDMKFAFKVAKHVKSNAIIYARDGATVGIGAGQMSRIDSTRIAAQKAAEAAKSAGLDKPQTHGSVVASDAFFPFADGLLAAAEAGATAVIQPGGSVRDDEVIKAANDKDLAMVFTGMRHFRH